MRYYLVTIQYNKEKEAENRTAPKAFDTLDEAVCAFHKQMGTDMANPTLGWAMSTIINSDGGQYPKYTEKWERPIEPEIEPEVEE